MNPLERLFPWAVIVLAGLFLLGAAMPPSDSADKMHVYEAAKLPVQEGGRIKPLDTYARNTLMRLSGRQTFVDENDDTQPAIKWLLDVMTSRVKWSEDVKQAETIRIDDVEIVTRLGLKARPDKLYSLRQVDHKKFAALFQEAAKASDKDANRRTPHEENVLKVAHAAKSYLDLIANFNTGVATERYKVFRIDNEEVLGLLNLVPRSGFRYSVDEFASRVSALVKKAQEAMEVEDDKRTLFEGKVIELARNLQIYQDISLLRAPHVIPSGVASKQWKSIAEARETVKEGEPGAPETAAWDALLPAYAKGDATAFNREVAAYASSPYPEMGKVGFEVFFNDFAPFYQCSLLYVIVFLLSCFAWVAWSGPLNRAAFMLMLLTLVVHGFALISRMYLMDRWFVFVTNLYSSAVFIGLGCVVLGAIVECIWPIGIGNVVGSALGALSLIIAHNLAAGGEDTLEMMRAVLDTNFWLATHVTCVTLGYVATFVAGFVGILFILRGFFTRSMDKETFKVFTQIIYGIVCFATLLSFTGTMLGGIWADQSWGRFWGWDVKENGALIIVIWNALVLHARWGGMVKQRGLAVLSVVGNIVTSWSWFGVNMLGVGLHSYGFMHGAQWWLLGADIAFLTVIGIGLTPLRYWQSFIAMETGPGTTRPAPMSKKAKRDLRRRGRPKPGFVAP
jgi:ABC-type transport system involved in cytochrome c biogenesis permease subunit